MTCRDKNNPVSVLVADDRIGQLAIEIVEPSLDAALARKPALAGICEGSDFEAVAKALRAAKPGADATKVEVTGKPRVGIGAKGDVRIDFDFRKG